MDIEQMYLVILHAVTHIFVNCLKILLQYQVIAGEKPSFHLFSVI